MQDTGNAMAAEKDPQVIAGQIAALAAGLSISSIRANAAQELSDAIATIACTQKTDPLHPCGAQAVAAATGNLRDQILNAGERARRPHQGHRRRRDQLPRPHPQRRQRPELSPAKSDTAAGRTEYADFGGLASGVLQLTGQSAVPKVAIPPHALTADINANNVQKDAAVVNAINEFVTASVNGFKVDGDPARSADQRPARLPHACSACWSPSWPVLVLSSSPSLRRTAPSPKADFHQPRRRQHPLAIISWQQDNRVARIVSEGLTRSDNLAHNFEPTPATAASWDVSEDKRTITFHIRKDAAWSNGEPLTAHDFVFSCAAPTTPDLWGDYMKLYEFIEGGKQFIACVLRHSKTSRNAPTSPPMLPA